jgi:putative ABC transport system permease protein
MNMYKLYLKQAWQMLKEDKVISIITILGTALAITMIMVIVMTQRIKTTNIGPEVNRERTMYIPNVMENSKKNNSMNRNRVRINNYKQYLTSLTTPEKISLMTNEQNDVCLEGSDTYHRADLKYIDAGYWSIYSFTFSAGRPFTNEEFQSGVPVAVISKSIARKLFNETSGAIGNTFILNRKPYRVIGVVEDVPTLCTRAYAQIWIPYTSSHYGDPTYTAYTVILLAKNKSDFDKIKSEVRRSEISNTPNPDEMEVIFYGPFSEEELMIKGGSSFEVKEPDLKKEYFRFYLTLFFLLLIPAINLSGFSLFKILNRTSEIGIRKAFGADKKTILMQVLYENLLISIIGGIIGLVFSYQAIHLVKDRLFGQTNWWEPSFVGENTIPVSAFISPAVFLYVFLACILLNLLSSGIPAWRASRLNIVEAIRY